MVIVFVQIAGRWRKNATDKSWPEFFIIFYFTIKSEKLLESRDGISVTKKLENRSGISVLKKLLEKRVVFQPWRSCWKTGMVSQSWRSCKNKGSISVLSLVFHQRFHEYINVPCTSCAHCVLGVSARCLLFSKISVLNFKCCLYLSFMLFTECHDFLFTCVWWWWWCWWL